MEVVPFIYYDCQMIGQPVLLRLWLTTVLNLKTGVYSKFCLFVKVLKACLQKQNVTNAEIQQCL